MDFPAWIFSRNKSRLFKNRIIDASLKNDELQMVSNRKIDSAIRFYIREKWVKFDFSERQTVSSSSANFWSNSLRAVMKITAATFYKHEAL